MTSDIREYHVTAERTKDTKDVENITFEFPKLVLFAIFVVKSLFSILIAALPR